MSETASVLASWWAERRQFSEWRMRLSPQVHVWMFLAAVTVCGLLFGGFVAGELNRADTAVLSHTVQTLLGAIQGGDIASAKELWWQRMIHDGQLLALIWLFGVSVIGFPFVVVAVFLRAFSIGFTIGFTVLQFGWKGFAVTAVAVFLHQLVSMSVILCAGVAAIRFSANILRQVYPLQRLTIEFLKYTSFFVLCVGGIAVGALLQAYVAPPILSALLVTKGP